MLASTRTPTGRVSSISSTARAAAKSRSASLISGSATLTSTMPGRATGSSEISTSFSRTPGRPDRAPISALVVALPAWSRARRARARSASSVSVAAEKRVGCGFSTRSTPRIGRLITPIRPAATTPALPASSATIEASTLSSPRRSVFASTVSNTAGAASVVETRVPAKIWMSAGAGTRPAEHDAAGRKRRALPRETDEGCELVEIAPGRGVEEASLVDRLELSRQHRVFAREAFGEQPRHGADIAIGQQRNRDEVRDRLIIREERRADVRPDLPPPDEREVGAEHEVAAALEALVGAAGQTEDAHRRGHQRLAGGEAIRRLLRQETEALADGAAGQRRQQIVDELAVGFGCVTHAPNSSENGTTRLSGVCHRSAGR